jgi:mitochondrial pyruvate carrier 1
MELGLFCAFTDDLVVTPRNYLLLACHIINEAAQLGQGYRYLNYWKCVLIFLSALIISWGGREAKLAQLSPEGAKVEKGITEQAVTTSVPPQTPA